MHEVNRFGLGIMILTIGVEGIVLLNNNSNTVDSIVPLSLLIFGLLLFVLPREIIEDLMGD